LAPVSERIRRWAAVIMVKITRAPALREYPRPHHRPDTDERGLAHRQVLLFPRSRR
jgi:hypothetical protein